MVTKIRILLLGFFLLSLASFQSTRAFFEEDRIDNKLGRLAIYNRTELGLTGMSIWTINSKGQGSFFFAIGSDELFELIRSEYFVGGFEKWEFEGVIYIEPIWMREELNFPIQIPFVDGTQDGIQVNAHWISLQEIQISATYIQEDGQPKREEYIFQREEFGIG